MHQTLYLDRNAVSHGTGAPEASSILRDPLTGLLTKHGFISDGDRLLPLMMQADEHPHVIFIELNNFEGIISCMEYQEVLELLRAVRRRLELAFGDDVLLAHFDGERFAALLPNAREGLDALTRTLDAPVVIGGNAYHLSVTCGVAAFPEAGNSMLSLILAARVARRNAANERMSVGISADDLRRRLARSRTIEDGLWTSRAGAGLSLVYQPKVEIRTGRVTGVEALMRWSHPELGCIPPSEFVPVAERTRAIIPLGEWLIRESLRQQSDWQRDRLDLSMSINISPVQLMPDPGHATVQEILINECNRMGLDRAKVELEITEGVLTDTIAMREVRRLAQSGFRIAIDDFGCDHSALSLLVDSPADTLKIDKSFVDNVLRNPRQATIIRFITGLAHDLGMDTVVEGIEDVRQLVAVAEAGCDYGQGYFYFRPMCADRIMSLHTAAA